MKCTIKPTYHETHKYVPVTRKRDLT